jgi:hypothetical protein
MATENFSHVASFQIWENAFTPTELDAIVAYGDRLALKRATVIGEGPEVYDPLRVTRLAAVPPGPDVAWLYQRIERVIRAVNQQTYRFDLLGFTEPFNYMVYDGAESGHFGWHVDNGRQQAPRKLSATLQLTDGESYEGCDLEFFGGHEPEPAPRARGALVVFPSYVLHRVTPIRSGTRKALVIWSTGPNFR